jgi:nucleotide sugar dehydrogenase
MPSRQGRAFILAAPTSVDETGAAAMASLRAACETALACAQDHDLLAIRSTVPVGTTRRFAREIAAAGRSIAVASYPERSISGRAFAEQFSVPHVVGGIDTAATSAARGLFQRLGEVVAVSTAEIAEAVKLFCNVQRDVTFALSNQFALTSEALGLDLAEIERAASAGYPRFHLSRPGPVGGPCLPKDVFLLENSVSTERGSAALALAGRQVNAFLLDHVASAITDHLRRAGRIEAVIAVLGLAFKGDPPLGGTSAPQT